MFTNDIDDVESRGDEGCERVDTACLNKTYRIPQTGVDNPHTDGFSPQAITLRSVKGIGASNGESNGAYHGSHVCTLVELDQEVNLHLVVALQTGST